MTQLCFVALIPTDCNSIPVNVMHEYVLRYVGVSMLFVVWGGGYGVGCREGYNLYGVDEHGSVAGETEMKAEIFARGPIACRINSDVPQFDLYRGGVITCNQVEEIEGDGEKEGEKEAGGGICSLPTDHVVVIAGWGVKESTGLKYWVGRNCESTPPLVANDLVLFEESCSLVTMQ